MRRTAVFFGPAVSCLTRVVSVYHVVSVYNVGSVDHVLSVFRVLSTHCAHVHPVLSIRTTWREVVREVFSKEIEDCFLVPTVGTWTWTRLVVPAVCN